MWHKQARKAALVLAVLALALAWAPPAAADWPQFLGPARDGTSPETGLLTSWPKKGPPVLWERKAGEGYSGLVLAGDRLILFHRVGDEEVVECLDPTTGKQRWAFRYRTSYRDDFNKGDGPRSTPIITDKHVFTLGAEGMLHCLDAATGKKVWGRSLLKEYDVPPSFFGVGTSPLLEGGLLLVNVGGKNAGIVAFAHASGKEIWRATTDPASYASPVAATFAGQRQTVFFTRTGVVLLDPANGKVRYEKRWRARGEASVNAASPLVIGNFLFFSASYGTGALLLRVSKDKVEEVWSGDESLSNHYNTSVYHDGHLYGCHGRQELGAELRCIELNTGKVRWTREEFGCASMIRADGHLIALTEKGDLVLIEPTPAAYREKARVHVFDDLPCRAEIALSNGRLYARDAERLVCINLKR
jgi:outer membrane protein assembly factor BamB